MIIYKIVFLLLQLKRTALQLLVLNQYFCNKKNVWNSFKVIYMLFSLTIKFY